MLEGYKHIRVLDPVGDARALHAIFSDHESCKYLYDDANEDLEATKALLKKWSKGCEDTSWAIVRGGGEALGRITCFNENNDGAWEVGIMLCPKARGLGLARKAMLEVVNFMDKYRSAKRIIADIDPENLASLSLFDRLGFKRVEYIENNEKTHLGWRDSIIMHYNF